MSRPPRRPTFLFIGGPKSGSTWIYDVLREHPEVFVPAAKDLQFFDRHYHLGMPWYLKHFDRAGAAKAVGELSHDYYMSAEAARRIREALPDVRLICCLREPGDFAISVLRWWQSHSRRFGRTLDQMTSHAEFARLLSYHKNLAHYFDLFQPENILVHFYEDLKEDPRRFASELYRFIGVDPAFEPASLGSRSNPTRPPRNAAFLLAAVAAAQILRAGGAATLVGAVKSHPLFERIAYGRAARPDPRFEEQLRRIADHVRGAAAKDHDALSRLIGRPVPDAWREAA